MSPYLIALALMTADIAHVHTLADLDQINPPATSPRPVARKPQETPR